MNEKWRKENRDRWNKYMREQTTIFSIRLTKKDNDVIEMLRKQPSVSNYLKKLVRADLEKKKENYENTKGIF